MLRDGVDRGAPLWLGVLQMAEAWGCHPEDVMTRPGGLKWAARWAAYRKEVRWVEEERRK
jgi:hypothetical protein